ncbi:MAG: hypothetical protein ACTSUE_07335 [Promethearchaeota archaeon]
MTIENESNSTGSKGDFWRTVEFRPLVNRDELNKITAMDPWQYQVADKLKNFLFRMERKKVVNFKISGIVLHSASLLCKAKSQSMIDAGSDIQESLDEEVECIDQMVDGCMEILDHDDEISGSEFLQGNKSLDEMLELVASGRISFSDVINKDKIAQMNAPKRVVARQLTMSDLSAALNDALKGKFRKKNLKRTAKSVFLPESLKSANGEELKVENIILALKERINTQFELKAKPLDFSGLFEKKSLLYIVKTFLAILYMINRKQVEAWQESNGKIFVVPFGKSPEFFVED